MKKVDDSGQLRKPVKREEQAQATGQLIEEAQGTLHWDTQAVGASALGSWL
jgi:hypothetical protein